MKKIILLNGKLNSLRMPYLLTLLNTENHQEEYERFLRSEAELTQQGGEKN